MAYSQSRQRLVTDDYQSQKRRIVDTVISLFHLFKLWALFNVQIIQQGDYTLDIRGFINSAWMVF